jgi:hypothetical protein
VITGACALIAALIGYLGVSTPATPLTLSVPTSRVTVTATVTRGTSLASPGSNESSQGSLPASEGWIPEFSDRVSLEAAWTNLDKFPPAEGSASDVQVVGHIGGVYLRAWKQHVMAKVPADSAAPARCL